MYVAPVNCHDGDCIGLTFAVFSFCVAQGAKLAAVVRAVLADPKAAEAAFSA